MNLTFLQESQVKKILIFFSFPLKIALEAFDDPNEVVDSPLNPDSYSRTKQVVHQLIKDLEKMKALAEIHGSVSAY